MRRSQLEHLIRAAGAILDVKSIIVIGSQAILASYDESDLPSAAVSSIEADLLPPDDPDGVKADLLDGAIGEASLFEDAFGIYGQGVGKDTARLPHGWSDRLVRIANENTGGIEGLCLEPHDLVVSKLLANREKDRVFCRALLDAVLVEPALLGSRLEATVATDAEKARITEFVSGAS